MEKKVDKSKKHFIKSFEIKNFRGIDDSGKVEILAETQWIFLTGENGFGKTSVLQALAVALCGRNGIETIGKPIIYVALHDGNEYYSNKRGVKHILTQSKFAAYGSSRLNIVKRNEDYEKSNNILYNLFNTDGVLKNIDTYLGDIFGKEHFQSQFEEISSFFNTLLNIQKIEVDTSEAKNKVFYIDETGLILSFDQLAAGYKNIIAMVGDMILRLSEKQKNIPFKELQGIAIIDEFDLHLHPKWQRRLPKILSEIFENVQFIVSTHSPIPLLGAPENSAFLKVTRNTEEGIKIEDLKYIEVRNLTPNTILTSPIFDFEEMIPDTHKPYERLRTGISFSEAEFNDLVRKRLEESLKKR